MGIPELFLRHKSRKTGKGKFDTRQKQRKKSGRKQFCLHFSLSLLSVMDGGEICLRRFSIPLNFPSQHRLATNFCFYSFVSPSQVPPIPSISGNYRTSHNYKHSPLFVPSPKTRGQINRFFLLRPLLALASRRSQLKLHKNRYISAVPE